MNAFFPFYQFWIYSQIENEKQVYFKNCLKVLNKLMEYLHRQSLILLFTNLMLHHVRALFPV